MLFCPPTFNPTTDQYGTKRTRFGGSLFVQELQITFVSNKGIMDLEQQFHFCFDWYKEYRLNNETRYDAIMDQLFNGSKISSAFIGNNVSYRTKEQAWEAFSRRNPQHMVKQFIGQRLYPIFTSLESITIANGGVTTTGSN